MTEGKRIAVVGSGITGLSSAWLLHRSGAVVTLFEQEASCGGHTLTDSTGLYPVDLGFQVYNLTTYPNLVGFLDALGVDTEPSDMSFSLSLDGGKLEWASHDLSTIFVQRKNIVSPTFLKMVWEVVRFGREAPQVVAPDQSHIYRDMTLKEYLTSKGYSDAFKFNYVLPMCAAVWSVPNAKVLAFPVQMLVRFWLNHHLLDLFQRPCWRVVKGRSKTYVDRVLKELPDVRTSTPIVSLHRNSTTSSNSKGVTLTTAAGESLTFDAVVLATHSDISLKILGDGATPQEQEVLGAIPYNTNDVYLHTDEALMPVDKRAWASWNFLGTSDTSDNDQSAVTVSYWLNRLQHLPPEAPQMFVTLNPPQPPAADKTIRRLALAHPVYSFESYNAQSRLPSIQGTDGVYFAGAWASYGFHEDGMKAGVAVAKLLGAEVPWGAGIATSPKMSLSNMVWLALFDRFARASVTVGQLRLILPNGEERHYGGAEDTIPAPVAEGADWRGLPPRRATVRVLKMDMFRKVVQRTDVGLGEAYMDGDYLVDNLAGLMALVVANARKLEGQKGLLGVANWINDKMLAAAHARRSNTRQGSRKNIQEHYDAGNGMYATFLDETMTYSAGIHTKDQSGDLQAAQLAKLDAVVAAADLKPDDHVLEIGCGWGSFAIRAASTVGCRVTGLTLSKQQLAEATSRVAAAGLSDKVQLLLCDYRDCPRLGSYDKVVSIEMIEAVGHDHLASYFNTINAALKPGGKAVIQVIAQPDERYETYCRSSDFIREHIFPGGHLPSMGAMVEAARGTQLAVTACRDIGPDYAMTLRAWRQAWNINKHKVLDLGYTEKFWLKYDFYFAYCEAAFDAKYIHDYHITWIKAGNGADVGPTVTDGVRPDSKKMKVDVVHIPGVIDAAGWVKQELPADSATQVLFAIYFFLAGLIVQRQPLLWVMPITSLCFALLQSCISAISSGTSTAYNSLSATAKASYCSAACQIVFSAVATAAALFLVVNHPILLLPRGVGVAVLGQTSQHTQGMGVSLGQPAAEYSRQLAGVTISTLMTCAAAGYYAFKLWVLVRGRSRSASSLLALLQYTVLLIVYSVSSYKGTLSALLAAALVSEAVGVAGAAGVMCEVLGHGDSRTRRAWRLLECGMFPCFRVLPQLYLCCVAALISTPHSDDHTQQNLNTHWYTAIIALALCQLTNYVKAKSLYSAGQCKSGVSLRPASTATVTK